MGLYNTFMLSKAGSKVGGDGQRRIESGSISPYVMPIIRRLPNHTEVILLAFIIITIKIESGFHIVLCNVAGGCQHNAGGKSRGH